MYTLTFTSLHREMPVIPPFRFIPFLGSRVRARVRIGVAGILISGIAAIPALFHPPNEPRFGTHIAQWLERRTELLEVRGRNPDDEYPVLGSDTN